MPVKPKPNRQGRNKSRQPLVSVIMLAYNHEKYVTDSLKGLFNQDFRNYEVIIRDDGSDDSTPELIQEYLNTQKAVKDIRTIVEYGHNIGIIKGYNWCLDKSSGDIVMGCASDDIYLPGRIRHAVELHQHYSDIDLIACNGEVIADNGQPIRDSFYRRGGSEMPGRPEITEFRHLGYRSALKLELNGFGMSYKKSLLKPVNYRLPETLLYEDGYLSFLAAVQNGAITTTTPLLKYRRSTGSVSRIDPSLDREEALKEEYRFLNMFLSLELNKYDYLKNNRTINDLIRKDRIKALGYLEQNILTTKLKLNAAQGIFSWPDWLKLFFLIIKGDKSKYFLKVLILSLARKKFQDSIISGYKNRSSIL